jgi:WD40 repeat protein
VSGSRDYFVRFWDVETGQCTFWPEVVQQNVVTDLRWMNNGETAVLQASEDLQLRLWDVRTKSVAQAFDDGPYFALHCDVSPCGNYFLTGHNGFEGVGCEIKLFDRRADRKCLSIQCASQAVTDACFLHVEGGGSGGGSSSGLFAACASKDGSLRCWDLAAILAAGDEVALSGKPTEVGLLASHHLDHAESVQSLCGASPVPVELAAKQPQQGCATIATGHVNGRVSTWTLDTKRRTLELVMQSQGQDES